MQLQIHSLSKRCFQRLENFCNRTNIHMRFSIVPDDVESYDVTIANFEKQCYFSSCMTEDILLIQSGSGNELYMRIDSSEFHKVVII